MAKKAAAAKEAEQEKRNKGRPKGGASYDAGKLAIIKAAVAKGLGWRRIVKQYPNHGFTEQGVKSITERLRKNPDCASRKPGTGR